MADNDETSTPDLGRAGSHVTHGGAGGLKRIEAGKELVGLASIEEHKVEAELAQPGGRRNVVQKQAQRLEACARLYWGAVCSALDAGDIERATQFIKIFAWVQAAAIRGMLAVDQVGDAEQLTLDSLLGRGEENGNED
jgi:hypothetical protein